AVRKLHQRERRQFHPRGPEGELLVPGVANRVVHSAGASGGGIILARLADALDRQYRLPQDPSWHVPGRGLLAGSTLVRRRARPVLGSRPRDRNYIQLVD